MPSHAQRSPHLISVGEIAQMLAGRILALAAELLPGGKRDGHEWRCGSLAGEAGKSLGVHLTGAKAGVWMDFTTGETGDALDLVAQVLFRGEMREALTWSRRWLGLDSGDPAQLAIARQAVQQRAAKAEDEADAARGKAWSIWLGAQPQIAGTPVESYLLGRGIDLAALGRQPRALRFHSGLWNVERGQKLPAMVAAIDGPDGFMATHRTWLERDAEGVWRKAALEQPKKVLGRFAGGCIRLWRGASGKALKDAPPGETLDVTEGIEDGLSVATAAPECRVVAAISLSNMGNIALPPAIAAVCLWRQNDTALAAIDAFDRAKSALRKRGLEILVPQIPGHLKDVNDLLREPV